MIVGIVVLSHTVWRGGPVRRNSRRPGRARDVDYRDGRWEVRYRDGVAGVLPEMPGYGTR